MIPSFCRNPEHNPARQQTFMFVLKSLPSTWIDQEEGIIDHGYFKIFGHADCSQLIMKIR